MKYIINLNIPYAIAAQSIACKMIATSIPATSYQGVTSTLRLSTAVTVAMAIKFNMLQTVAAI